MAYFLLVFIVSMAGAMVGRRTWSACHRCWSAFVPATWCASRPGRSPRELTIIASDQKAVSDLA